MQDVYIVAANRTAFGKMGGALREVRPDALACAVLQDILPRGGVAAEQVDEVILGQTRQSAEAANIARYAALLAGYPERIPAYTVMQQCSSAMQAIQNAAYEIALGQAGVIVAGGVESMSMAPFYLKGGRYGLGVGNRIFADPVTEGSVNSQPVPIYGAFGTGDTAENVAEQYGISREDQDAFAFESQSRYQAALEAGKFQAEIVAVPVPQKKGEPVLFDRDESPRLTPLEKLAQLKPVFRKGGTVTAANSCPRSDGAAAVLLAGEKAVKELGLTPMGRIVGQASAGVDPRIMGIGPIPAAGLALKRTGLSMEDMGLVELNEAFAAQSLACIRELGMDPRRVNVNGGAIAIGHPNGATGARLVGTLLYEMARRGVRYGLATLCVGGGMGSAVIVERV